MKLLVTVHTPDFKNVPGDIVEIEDKDEAMTWLDRGWGIAVKEPAAGKREKATTDKD